MGQAHKKVLPSDEEIAERTGKTVAEWLVLIESAGMRNRRYGEIVGWLLDEHNLQLFYAHAIGHKLTCFQPGPEN